MPDGPKPASLKAFGINCSLKGGSKPSSTEALMRQLFEELAKHDVEGEIVRAADHDINAGVSSDEGDGDAWPEFLTKVREADILVIGSPIRLGQPSSIAKHVLERMHAFLNEKDSRGRMPSHGKVAICAIVGNEDGAHHGAAEILSALLEVGFTVPSGGSTYWAGATDYKDFSTPPEAVAKWNAMLASNAAHLARLLKAANYPGIRGER